VVFIDDESLEEVLSFRLTMRKLYIIISTMFVLVAVATVSIVVLTPVKYYIPGYAGGKTRLEVVKLKQNVDSLSDLVAAQEKYQENLRNVISGNMKTPLDTTMLDLKKTRQEEINSLLPASGELMKQAARGVKKDKEKAGQ
jgi:DMSO/TMAO reductase YedYZ molybdopterin-dependent catalytic subunit